MSSNNNSHTTFFKYQKDVMLKETKSLFQMSSFGFLFILGMLYHISEGNMSFVVSNVSWVLPVTLIACFYYAFSNKNDLQKEFYNKLPDEQYIRMFLRNSMIGLIITSIFLLSMTVISLFIKQYFMNVVEIKLLTEHQLNVVSNVIITFIFSLSFVIYYFILEKVMSHMDKKLDEFESLFVEIEGR